MTRIRSVLRDNGLGLVFGLLFLASLVGQAFAGHAEFNQQQVTEGHPPISMAGYLTSSSFAVDVSENWQSEYLQFFLYVFATVWLTQRGSPESKNPKRIGHGSDREQQVGEWASQRSPWWVRRGGMRRRVFSMSLGLVMGTLFVLSWLAQALSGWADFNMDQAQHHQAAVSWVAYLGSADFWSRTLQNWQSEFLAVGSMAVFSVYLRHRGSPESKPVGSPHADTGETG